MRSATTSATWTSSGSTRPVRPPRTDWGAPSPAAAAPPDAVRAAARTTGPAWASATAARRTLPSWWSAPASSTRRARSGPDKRCCRRSDGCPGLTREQPRSWEPGPGKRGRPPGSLLLRMGSVAEEAATALKQESVVRLPGDDVGLRPNAELWTLGFNEGRCLQDGSWVSQTCWTYNHIGDNDALKCSHELAEYPANIECRTLLDVLYGVFG